MDKEDYVQKTKELLDQPTSRTISSGPTTKYKNKLVNSLKAIKAEGGIDETLYTPSYHQLYHSMYTWSDSLTGIV